MLYKYAKRIYRIYKGIFDYIITKNGWIENRKKSLNKFTDSIILTSKYIYKTKCKLISYIIEIYLYYGESNGRKRKFRTKYT